MERRALSSDDEILAFAKFASLLVRKDRNRGEAGVLALASVVGGVAVVDDGAACRAAEQCQVKRRRTLALLCDAIRQELLTVKLVSALADDLLISEYRLPFEPGEFERWAAESGLLL